jgi:sugar phosphate isomerase/epimerase
VRGKPPVDTPAAWVYFRGTMTISRRCFLQRSAQATVALPFCSSAAALLSGTLAQAQTRSAAASLSIPADVLNRIAVTTSTFRFLFAPPVGSQQPADWPPPPRHDLTTLTAPQYIADQTGLRNLELWSPLFGEDTIPYAEQVRQAAEKAGLKIVNVQLDTRYNLSHPDPAERAASVVAVKRWMDISKAAGSPSGRVNTGGSVAGEAFDVKITGESFKQLLAYGQKIGLKVLLENHTGFSRSLDNLLAVLKYVDDPGLRVIFDWGNTLNTTEDRLAGIHEMMPYIELISAKGRAFDEQYRHTTFEIEPLVRELERSGFQGLYSVELWNNEGPILDPARAVRSFAQTIADTIQASRTRRSGA